MKRKEYGNWVIIGLVILNILVWIIFPAEKAGAEHYWRAYIGEILGSTVIMLMSFSLFISTRPRWAEKYFGGLDKMYLTHRRTSTSAFLLMFIHLLIVPLRVVDLLIGNYLAMIAFLGITAIVLVTLAPRIPFLNKLSGETYEGWKNLHRFIGIFFIIGYIHSVTVRAPTAHIAITWTQTFFILGTLSYLYAEVFGRFFKKYVPYTVEAVNHPNNSTTEVVLRAKGSPIQHAHAGQFLFVKFEGEKALNESHPFTISSAPSDDYLRLTIKASGDFTRHLFANLKAGTSAIVEGAYGMFNYKTGGEKQIWIAGGIGVTPFLSFLRDLKDDLHHHVDFYYAVRHKAETVFVEEIESIVAKYPRLKPYIRFSAEHGSLTVDEIVKNAGGDIRGHHVYMCGPLPMVQAFEKKFIEVGVPAENIHFEEFNFR